MSLPGSLLAVLADADVTFVVLIIGIIGLVGEFHHPGTLLPGIMGALGLALALVGFGELGVNWIGVTLVVLAAGLFIAEAHAPRVGLLALGGVLSFVVGSWLLFAPRSGPSHLAVGSHVSPWLIAIGALALSGYFLIILRVVLRARRLPSMTGAEALLGREGVATSDLTLHGTVRIGGEDWSAIAEVGPIAAGETVEVLGVEGITLHVHQPYEWQLPDGSSR
jgi:membrane-bound serine protease (ClpP class)